MVSTPYLSLSFTEEEATKLSELDRRVFHVHHYYFYSLWAELGRCHSMSINFLLVKYVNKT